LSYLLNHLNYPNVCSENNSADELKKRANDHQLFPSGSYAIGWEDNGEVFLARDPLGINKLFYGFDCNGRIVAANRIHKLIEHDIHMDSVMSCPAGRLVKIHNKNITEIGGAPVSDQPVAGNFNLCEFQSRVSEKLELYFDHVAMQWPDANFVICLSGGLDSSIIASMAAKKLSKVFAASFSFANEKSILNFYDGSSVREMSDLSDDFQAAIEVAEILELPLIPVFRQKNAILNAAALAIRLNQDWRDFNVHCAVVNLFLAQDIRATFPDEKVVILTGDLMNEYVCDYHEEVVDGKVYYPQPNIDIVKRRRFFMRGLDAGDREVGVFNAYGLPVCQPFSAVADDYVTVPDTYLDNVNAKMLLNSHLLPDKLLGKVGKAKVRAQVGGKDGGVLGAFHRLGLSGEKLMEIWKSGFPADALSDDPSDIIQFGRYRTKVKDKI
jgi:Asparagine synthase